MVMPAAEEAIDRFQLDRRFLRRRRRALTLECS
jgi:hypothetical protein